MIYKAAPLHIHTNIYNDNASINFYHSLEDNQFRNPTA